MIPADFSRLVQVDVAGIDPHAIQRAIDDIYIGEPIRSAFHPRILFKPEYGTIEISITSLDSGGGQHPLNIIFSNPIPPGVRDQNSAIAFIRECLIYVLTHELDESLRWREGGALINDPHAR